MYMREEPNQGAAPKEQRTETGNAEAQLPARPAAESAPSMLAAGLPRVGRLEDSSFNWVVGRKVAIGNYIAAQDPVLLREEGIKSIFCLTDQLVRFRPAELGVEKIVLRPLLDGMGNNPKAFALSIDELVKLVREHSPVLVHCHAGRSRSIVAVAAYLMKTEGYSPDVALKLVKKQRSAVLQPGLKDLLKNLR